MITSALKWIGDSDGYLELVDQRRLPGEFVTLSCRDVTALHEAIKELAVRGAPAIGVAAAYGLVLATQSIRGKSLEKGLDTLDRQAAYLASSRPTAVNLFWALDRVKTAATSFVQSHPKTRIDQLREVIWNEATAIYNEDVDMCRRIGEHGRTFIANGCGVLTHCNAGALACAGQGTALSVMFEAHRQGKRFTVYVDETRPLLQGARLTAWELQQAGIETVLICDNMAGWLMKQGRIDVVITGADRITANGDTANKIGTYSLSILAAKHGIPFYIAAPSSTFDLFIESGEYITIEQRNPREITHIRDVSIAPKGINTQNPAFDVTEAESISAIITERGVIEKPTRNKIVAHFDT